MGPKVTPKGGQDGQKVPRTGPPEGSGLVTFIERAKSLWIGPFSASGIIELGRRSAASEKPLLELVLILVFDIAETRGRFKRVWKFQFTSRQHS